MIKTYLTPPPCPEAWISDMPSLLCWSTRPLDDEPPSSLLAFELTRPSEVRSCAEALQLWSERSSEALSRGALSAHSPLEMWHLHEHQGLASCALEGALGDELRLAFKALSTPTCQQLMKSVVSAELRGVLRLVKLSGVQLIAAAPHPLWLNVLQAELLLSSQRPNSDLDLLISSPVTSPVTLPVYLKDLAQAQLKRHEGGLLALRSPQGITLIDAEGEVLYGAEGLSRDAWSRWLTQASLLSNLPLSHLEALIQQAQEPPSSPEVRDSVYKLDYEEALSGHPDASTELSGPLHESVLQEQSFKRASEQKIDAVPSPLPTLKTSAVSDFEEDEESSVFTELSLSDVDLESITDRELISSSSAEEARLHEQLERADRLRLEPSSSFDLSALNLSESTTHESTMRAHTALDHRAPSESDESQGTHTFNEFPDHEQTLHKPLSSEDEAEVVFEPVELADVGAPTHIDLNRDMISAALAQLDEESPTTTEPAPIPQADYIHAAPTQAPPKPPLKPDPIVASAPTKARPNPALLQTLGLGERSEHHPVIHEEPTRVSATSGEPVLSEEAKERRNSFSDVVRRLKGGGR